MVKSSGSSRSGGSSKPPVTPKPPAPPPKPPPAKTPSKASSVEPLTSPKIKAIAGKTLHDPEAVTTKQSQALAASGACAHRASGQEILEVSHVMNGTLGNANNPARLEPFLSHISNVWGERDCVVCVGDKKADRHTSDGFWHLVSLNPLPSRNRLGTIFPLDDHQSMRKRWSSAMTRFHSVT